MRQLSDDSNRLGKNRGKLSTLNRFEEVWKLLNVIFDKVTQRIPLYENDPQISIT
jgi:hypothetical protein